MKKKILFLGTALVLVLSGCGQTNETPEAESLSSTETKNKVEEFVNQYMVQEGKGQAKVADISEEGGMYKAVIELQGQSIDTYVTKDGKKLFPQVIDMENPEGEQAGGQEQAQPAQEPMSSSDQAKIMAKQGRDLLDQYGEKVNEEEKNNLGEKLEELEDLNESDDARDEDLNKKMEEVQEVSGPLVDEAMKEQQEQQQQQQGGNAPPAPQPVE